MQFLNPQLPPFLVQFIWLSLWLTILVAVFVPLERLFAVYPKKVLRKGIGADLGYFFLSGLLPAMLLSAPLSLLALSVHKVIPQSLLDATAALPFLARILVALVVSEIGYYWAHRMSHEIPFLWRFHAIHHSAAEVDFLVNSRSHPIDMVFSRFCALVPIYVLGLGNPQGLTGNEVPIVVSLISIVWGFFIHANVRWRFGPLEWLISTPGFHHWHHTKNGPINHNYASTLPWLDWIFGTLHRSAEWPSEYGIQAKLPDSLVGQLAYPLLADPVASDQPATPESTVGQQPRADSPQPLPAEPGTDLSVPTEHAGMQETH